MTDIIYLYPQTLCPCNSCKKTYPLDKGNETNLSVRGCQVSPFFDCYNTLEFRKNIRPNDNSGIEELNPQVYTNKIATGFNRVACKTSQGCPQPSYISMDPRLYSTTRMDYLPLDRPPMDGDVKLKDIYNDKYTNYGLHPKTYKDIDDGQISYYIDKSIEDAFYKPVYSEPAHETSILYQDPMGSMKPEYNRTPILNNENPTTTEPIEYPYCLSYIQDTQSFREDLMALQQRKNNQEKWSARWEK